MEEVEVFKDETRDPENAKHYVAVLNGLVSWCLVHGYRHGNRNTIALDLTVAAYQLGLNPLDVLEWFMNHDLILSAVDDEDPETRVGKAMDYYGSFCWDYMIDVDDILIYTPNPLAPLVFVLKD